MKGDFSMPDMFNRRDYYFTDEELYAIGRAIGHLRCS